MPALTLDSDRIRAIGDVFGQGLALDAFRQAEDVAPLRQWQGVEPCLLGARIAASVGAPTLALRLVLRACRAEPENPASLCQYAYEMLHRRGALAFWELTRDWQWQPHGVAPAHVAELLAMKGLAASELRDFALAEEMIGMAESLAPSIPWIRLQRAHLLEHLDRIEEGLGVAEEVLRSHPHRFYRPAVQVAARLRQLLNRDEEAIALLTAADAVLQSGPLARQRYALLSDNGRWTEAELALERFATLSPLLERPLRTWRIAQCARTAYHLGRRADAATMAGELDDDFHRAFALRLAVPATCPERLHLEVSFVRQHFKTCAPATLAAIGRYWRMPTDHLKLAEAMCYDGTPSWQQRQWAEGNGWFVREFRVTFPSAMALIERGVPFAISVVDATSAHMMAVIGVDRTRGTLLLRDPGQPYVREVAAEEYLAHYRAFGPRGMVFLPEAERGRLEGLTLPDAAIYDKHHALQVFLAHHDRLGATDMLRLAKDDPDHPLTWVMRLELAAYDANVGEQARCLDRLLEIFPGNPARLLQRLACMHESTREERIQFLVRACAIQNVDPALAVELARSLLGDARDLPQARHWLRRAMRLRQCDAEIIGAQAGLLWEEGRWDEATDLYRFAATFAEHRESLFQSWFIACRRMRRTDEALRHLKARFTLLGGRSAQPAMTLAWAWREMEQPLRAREVLAEAERLRPGDGDLSLSSGRLFGALGDFGEADRRLVAAKGAVRDNDWLRTAASIAEMRLDMVEALRHHRAVLALEPLALDVHAGVVRALVQHEGLAAGLAHLEAAASQFPHHYGLRRLWVEWGRDRDPTAAEPVVRALLGLAPSDAWARRELVVILDKAGRHDEAHREAEEAARIEPRNSYSHSILGHACQSLGRRPESRSHFVRAIELSVDNDDALRALLDLARTDEERKRDLGFIEQQLLRQVVTGDGLLAFMELARPILDPETLLQSLRLAHAERPDLWHAWSALGSQLAHLGHLDEATEVARQATDRFPHLPRIWLDLAQAHRLRNAPQEEIAAARRAVEINPAWSVSALALADALERAGSMADAHAVYERALMHLADDAQVHAMHAHLLWRQRKPSEALDAVERALRLAPGYGWAWNVLNEWAIACGQPMRPFEFAHLLARESPGDRHIWLALTRLTDGPETLAERLAAVDKALALDAHWVDAWDMKAVLLVEAERFDEAAAACEVGMPLCPVDAHILQGRRAWIESQRCQLPEAIERMRTILAENASYAWGWSQLARWLVEQDELAEATLALKHLRRLRPHDPWVYRQLGELHLRQEDRQGTREAFAMALRLSPADVAAAHHIFDLQVQSGDLVEAENTLRIMQMHQPGAQTLAAEIQLRLREKDVPAAIKLLQSLSVSTDPAPWPLNAAAEAFRHAGRSRQALRTLRRTLRNEESCNPQTGAAAIRLLLDGGRATAATWLFLKICRPEIQRRAAAPLVKALAQRRCRCLLWCLLWRCREALANDDDAWAQVGYALVSIGSMKKAAQWLDDWQTRANVQPWVLFDLCLALRKLGRCDEANEIAEHVVRTWAHREGAADMRLFLAVEAALAGTLQVAAEHLRLVVVRDQVAYDQEMLALAKELLDFQMAKPEDRPRQFKALRIRLDKRFSPWQILTKRGDVRNTFRRAGRVFVSEGGGWPARLWVCWKLNWQWLVLPFAPLLLLLLLQPASWVVFLMWYAATGRTRINTPAN